MTALSSSRFRLIVAYVVYGACVLILAGGVYQNTLRGALTELRDNGSVRLSEAAGRLRLQIDGYRALANVVASEPRMAEAMRTDRFARAADVLAKFEATYGAWRIDLMNPEGQLLASSASGNVNPTYPASLLRAAINNRLGFAQALEDGQRMIRLSRGVLTDGPRASGVVVVSVSLSALEFEWPVSPEPIVFFDAGQLSFSANRPNLLLLSRTESPEEASFDLQPTARIGRFDLWQFRPPDAPVSEVIKVEQFVSHLDLTGVIFLDTSNARATSRLRAILVVAGGVVLGLIGTITLQQRRRRLLEELYTAELELRVEDRTKELRGTQDALVEASKLAALGRLSAGVSHELNQPLGAILNFAENGQKFLERGRPEPVAQNLTLISDQVRRITRIIGNLRAFARQEVAPTEEIDFVEIVDAALGLVSQDIDEAGVGLDIQLSDPPLVVLAGRVRLEQVILNLITNALDAMSDASAKTLSVRLSQSGDDAVLTIADTGHGIADTTRVFEPFYTTKDLGASKGLGMGLALSHGIVTRFGGALTCRNLQNGAEFTLSLPLSQVDHA